MQCYSIKMYEQMIDYRLSIAPMVGHTNRYFRYTMRKISQKILLFTEMISSSSILRGQNKKILTFSLDENPVICQLAGNNPKDMGLCAKIIEDYGYCGINLNIGCPSAKVQKGGFGVCLMKQPKLVSEIITEIKKNTKLPISIKTRIGIDEQDSLEFLLNFIQQCFEAGVEVFVLHARKALLNYNTRNNRKIPPINYNRVVKIKDHFPHLKIIVNGEITSLEQSKHFLQNFDGTMIGRQAVQNPLLFKNADSLFWGHQDQNLSVLELLSHFFRTTQFQLHRKCHLMQASRHLFNLFHSFPNAKYWRAFLCRQLQTYPFQPHFIHKEMKIAWKKSINSK